jgi:hypothetical protein
MRAMVSALSAVRVERASRRPPQVLQNVLSIGLEVPQIAQRTSNAAESRAPQLLQNLLLALFGDPQCEQ